MAQKKYISYFKYLISIGTIIIIAVISVKSKTPTMKLSKSVQLHVPICPKYTNEEREMLENGWENQLDPGLLTLIRCEWIQPPSRRPLSPDLKGRYFKTAFGQTAIVDMILNKRNGGFFVECGALDGDKMSNTLFFERKRNWTGLLIEANPNEFEKLLMKGRNAYSLNACLNAEKRTGRFLFDPVPISGGLVDKMAPEHKKSLKADLPKINVQCFTFDSVMKALGHTHIDLFSLDVEGAEIPILQSIPFSDFTIDVILVEYFVVGSASKRKIKYNQIKDLLNQTQMYDFVGTIHSFDMLFVRKGILDEEKLKMWREKLSGKI